MDENELTVLTLKMAWEIEFLTSRSIEFHKEIEEGKNLFEFFSSTSILTNVLASS
jgi:hypothetical protein